MPILFSFNIPLGLNPTGNEPRLEPALNSQTFSYAGLREINRWRGAHWWKLIGVRPQVYSLMK